MFIIILWGDFSMQPWDLLGSPGFWDGVGNLLWDQFEKICVWVAFGNSSLWDQHGGIAIWEAFWSHVWDAFGRQ